MDKVTGDQNDLATVWICEKMIDREDANYDDNYR